MPSQAVTLTPELVRRNARIIWFALCMGLALYATVLLVMIRRHTSESQTAWIMTALVWAMTFTVIPLGLFARGQIFKRHWEGDVVKPVAYLRGNVVAWACCEGMAFISLVFGCFITGSILTFIPGAIAFVMLLLLYPNGKAMFPPDSGNPYQQQR